jgi:outer membrane receptor protein involved in Fe transport
VFGLFALKGGPQLQAGRQQQNVQHQFNVVDGLSVQVKRHALKFGVDFRRLSPSLNSPLYLQNPNSLSMASVEACNPDFSFIESNLSSSLLFRNLGVYAQDNWRITPRLTLTYGIRWDVDFAPSRLTRSKPCSGYGL